jgi:hypothetical protein
MQRAKRIITTRVAARRLEISLAALAKHIRRGLLQPDYESDAGFFFEPARLPELGHLIQLNRQRNWRHISAV